MFICLWIVELCETNVGKIIYFLVSTDGNVYVHIDYAGNFKGHMYLVIVDAYTKWLEIIIRKSITSLSTINALRNVFSQHSLACQIVSDNATNFSSAVFDKFCK